ncbi:unnamed protein product [Phaedon cochleariae]|uniref:Uncharacterized protein n=1 Tax=Phaedon cochleariae TaxID=80249 RepID=A0A9N9S8F3_PHACE|nr:unnamed protein product [Phaedon cochleariae]
MDEEIFNEKRSCFICKSSDDSVISFKRESFHKCKHSLQIRQLCNLKYNEASLSHEIDDRSGYHISCYRSFNAIGKKHKEQFERLQIDKDKDAEPGTSQSGDKDAKPGTSQFGDIASEESFDFSNTGCVPGDYEAGTEVDNNMSKKATKEVTTEVQEDMDNETNEEGSTDGVDNADNETTEEVGVEGDDDAAAEKTKCIICNKVTKYKNRKKVKMSKMTVNAKVEAFKKKITIITPCGGKTIIAPYDVTTISNLDALKKEDTLQRAAIHLRNVIFQMKKKTLPNKVETKDLIAGECDIPEILKTFYKTVLGGFNYHQRHASNLDLRSETLSSDLIYATTRGRIKPAKQIELGIALKSLTNSKKVLNIMNKLGHCISYSVIEELETEAAYTSFNKSSLCPSNIIMKNDLHTGVAFDNFDRFVETTTEKETLHDTVGIIYQNICEDNNESVLQSSTDGEAAGKKRRRTFDTIIPEVEPLAKRLKFVGQLQRVDSIGVTAAPANLKEFKIIDVTWMISHALDIKTPMWVGFNAKLLNDTSVTQIVSYLPPINLSPSDPAVVLETLLQSHGVIENKIDNIELRHLAQQYLTSKEETLAGLHGKTPQFYMIYTNLIDHYLMFSRSIRMGDFDLLKYILPKLNNIFFPFNHINYARWLVRYCDNLSKVGETHPELLKDFQDGYLGIKRTNKNFSRQGADLVVEQTINADAGRTLTGITHFTNSIKARMRWTVDFALRSEEDRIRKSRMQMANFINGLNLRMNPFDESLKEELLYNISTGEAAPKDVALFLTSIESTGNEMRTSMINACIEDEDAFHNYTIKRVKINNFASVVKKRKIRIGGKVTEVKFQKDLFGRLLAISLKKKIDLTKVLTYPLTPVPLSMCQIEGIIHKTGKSALTATLESKVQDHGAPQFIDVKVVDGFFLFHTMKQVPVTFGNVSLKYLTSVCSAYASQVLVVFDQYVEPSIKAVERNRRECFPADFFIYGSEQVRPSNFSAELRNDKFKTALVEFLIEHWSSDDAAEIIKRKVLYVSFDKCYKYVVEEGHVVRTIDEDISCPVHEEADTKIIFHLCQMENDYNVEIQCSDTDVLVIMLANMCHLKANLEIWLRFSTETASSDEETDEDVDEDASSDGIAGTNVDAFDYNADLSDDERDASSNDDEDEF